MSKTAELAISAYNSICKVPVIVGGRLTAAPSFAAVDFKQRCIPSGEWESYTFTTSFTDGSIGFVGLPTPLGKSSVFVSPSSKKQISLKTSATDAKQQFLLYWNTNRLEYTVDLKALDLHQQVDEKSPFSAAAWSPDERHFFYLAEKKAAKTRSYFDQKPVKAGDDTVPGNEYKYVEDWGEQLTGIAKTVVGVFDSNEPSVKLLNFDGGDDKCITKLFTNPVNADQLFAIVHHTAPFRLGLVYCTQRRSDLVCLTNLQSETVKVASVSDASQYLAILDATVSPNGKRIAWLQCTAGGPHNRAFELWTSETDTFKPRQVTSTKACPLYFDSQGVFRRSCWLNDHSLVLQSSIKTKTVLLSIDVDSSVVAEINVGAAKNSLASFSLLDVSNNGCLLVQESSFAAAPALLVGQGSPFTFKRFAPFPTEDSFLDSKIAWELKTTTYSSYECQYIYALPKNVTQKVPLIVIPHGGPHSAFTTAFAEQAAALVVAGFGVIMINYPGSIGFDSVDDLPGRVGTLDVESCQHCVTECLASGKFDKDNVFVYGGSHGGFLALHLIAQYADFYRAAVCRNPVTDFVQMVGCTDIPDWNFVECGLDPSLSGFSNLSDITKTEVLTKMNEPSPSRFVKNVKCPLLMAVGRNDRRVPMSQGISYCRMLKQANPQVPIEIFSYDDEHSLMKIPVHSDVFVNVLVWFNKYRK